MFYTIIIIIPYGNADVERVFSNMLDFCYAAYTAGYTFLISLTYHQQVFSYPEEYVIKESVANDRYRFVYAQLDVKTKKELKGF